jgi:hypothetical protein
VNALLATAARNSCGSVLADSEQLFKELSVMAMCYILALKQGA